MVAKTADLLKSFKDEIKSSVFTRSFLITNLALIIGCLVSSYAFNKILLELKLVSPGVTGLVIILYYLTNWLSVGTLYIIVNIPIYFLAWRYISSKFVLINMLGTAYFSLSLIITSHMPQYIHLNNELLEIILAAVLVGTSTGFYYRYGGAVGGLDIIAAIIRKKIGIGTSAIFTINNTFILLCNLAINDLSVTLYSAIYMAIMTAITVKTQTGFSQRLVALIITKKPKEISTLVNAKLYRSSTFLRAIGSYSNKETEIVYIIINLFELGRLKEIVYAHDPSALLTIISAAEIVGQKFMPWEEQGYNKKKGLKKIKTELLDNQL